MALTYGYSKYKNVNLNYKIKDLKYIIFFCICQYIFLKKLKFFELVEKLLNKDVLCYFECGIFGECKIFLIKYII